MSWIPKVTPQFEEPRHLTSVVDVFEAIKLGKAGLRVVIHAPPQHCKTETIMHGLNWLLRNVPNQQHAYATYSQDRSLRVSAKCRDVANRGKLNPDGIQKFWGHSGSKILWTSVGGPLTGEPVTSGGLLVVDDPNKDRTDAESPTIQSKQRDWLHDVAITRCHPGASIVINATRWCANDLAGYAIKELGFKYICLPALSNTDEPLWASQRPYEFLNKVRQSNAYTWASLYQGQPKPRGKQVFKGATTYLRLPDSGRVTGYGLDMAYTSKTQADWSVMIRGVMVAGTLYVTGMRRAQAPIEEWQQTMGDFTRKGSRILWYVGGQEGTIAKLVRPNVTGRILIVKPATIDKYTRAMPASEAWNMGRIQVPHTSDDSKQPEWLEDLLAEVNGFTGVNDFHDDIVDALAALWDLLSGTVANYDSLLQEAQASMANRA